MRSRRAPPAALRRGELRRRIFALTTAITLVSAIPKFCDTCHRTVLVRDLMDGALAGSVEVRVATYERMARGIVIGASESIRALTRAGMRDASDEVRASVARSVVEWLGVCDIAVGVLGELSADTSELVRRAAFHSMTRHGESAPGLRDLIAERLADAPDFALVMLGRALESAWVMSTAERTAFGERLLAAAFANVGRWRQQHDSWDGFLYLAEHAVRYVADPDDRLLALATRSEDADAQQAFLEMTDPHAISDAGRASLESLIATDDAHVRSLAEKMLSKSREK